MIAHPSLDWWGLLIFAVCMVISAVVMIGGIICTHEREQAALRQNFPRTGFMDGETTKEEFAARRQALRGLEQKGKV